MPRARPEHAFPSDGLELSSERSLINWTSEAGDMDLEGLWASLPTQNH